MTRKIIAKLFTETFYSRNYHQFVFLHVDIRKKVKSFSLRCRISWWVYINFGV